MNERDAPELQLPNSNCTSRNCAVASKVNGETYRKEEGKKTWTDAREIFNCRKQKHHLLINSKESPSLTTVLDVDKLLVSLFLLLFHFLFPEFHPIHWHLIDKVPFCIFHNSSRDPCNSQAREGWCCVFVSWRIKKKFAVVQVCRSLEQAKHILLRENEN